MSKIILPLIFGSKKTLLFSFLLLFFIQFHSLLGQQSLIPGGDIFVCEGKAEIVQPPPFPTTGTGTLTSELYTFYIESSGGLPTEIQRGSTSSVSILADGGTALNSVKDGDIIIGVASFTFFDTTAPNGVSFGGGTISSTRRLRA